MQEKYLIYPWLSDKSSMLAIPGGPTLMAAESRLRCFLFEAGMRGIRDQLESIGIGTSGGAIQASYAGNPESVKPTDGFEIRGVFSGNPDADSLPLSSHVFLADAMQELRVMEHDPKSLGGYSYIYVASALKPALDLDGFEPQQASGWINWFHRLIDETRFPYLVIAKPFRGILSRIHGCNNLQEAQTHYQRLKTNPFGLFVRMARAILLIDSKSGKAIDEFLVADRQEELGLAGHHLSWNPRFQSEPVLD